MKINKLTIISLPENEYNSFVRVKYEVFYEEEEVLFVLKTTREEKYCPNKAEKEITFSSYPLLRSELPKTLAFWDKTSFKWHRTSKLVYWKSLDGFVEVC